MSEKLTVYLLNSAFSCNTHNNNNHDNKVFKSVSISYILIHVTMAIN